jgi:hypothetical protein
MSGIITRLQKHNIESFKDDFDKLTDNDKTVINTVSQVSILSQTINNKLKVNDIETTERFIKDIVKRNKEVGNLNFGVDKKIDEYIEDIKVKESSNKKNIEEDLLDMIFNTDIFDVLSCLDNEVDKNKIMKIKELQNEITSIKNEFINKYGDQLKYAMKNNSKVIMV